MIRIVVKVESQSKVFYLCNPNGVVAEFSTNQEALTFASDTWHAAVGDLIRVDPPAYVSTHYVTSMYVQKMP